jgi:hypothetical protein
MKLNERLKKLEKKKSGCIKIDIVDDFGDGVYRYKGETYLTLEELPPNPPNTIRLINEFNCPGESLT